jgi:signal peptidase I
MSTKKNKPARGPAKTSPKASPAARQGAPVSPARGGPEAGRIHGTALVWTGLLVVSLALNGCPRFTVYYAAYLAVSIGLALGSLAFVRAVYLRGRTELHLGFKKFVGYSLVLHYAAAALPRVDWSTAGLIGPGRVAFLFALCLLCLAAGIFLFFLAGRPKALAELGILNAEELRDRALRRKRLSVRKKGFIPGLLDWVDALAFAVIAVIVVNIFVFQLYRIPSESMVPVFLNGDRPFTIKAIAGPKIPLTAWRLPIIKLPSRGDVVTIANPRYPENHRVDLKKYLTQLVAMVTFTAVNIDPTAPDGSPKADPLVKRVVGLPGEKLMMVDDLVYSKRKGDAAYALVEADRRWAKTDLWKESAAVRSHIEEIPVDEDTRAILVAWDAKKRDSDPAALAASLVASLRAIEAALPSRRVAALEADLVKKLPDTGAGCPHKRSRGGRRQRRRTRRHRRRRPRPLVRGRPLGEGQGGHPRLLFESPGRLCRRERL